MWGDSLPIERKETTMHSIHLRDIHTPKGPNLFLIAVGGIVCFSIALFFFLASWLGGGDNYEGLIGGNGALGVLLGGVVLSAVLAAVTRPHK
jgi:hypothetical protein